MEGWDSIDSGATQDFAGGEANYPTAATYPEHDCYAWNRAHYLSTPDYHATVCGTCDKIIGFRWRSWTKRLRSLFTSDPDHVTREAH